METRIPLDHVRHNTALANRVPIFWDLVWLKLDRIHKEKKLTGRGVHFGVLDTGYTPHDVIPEPKFLKNYTRSRHGAKDVNGHGNWCNGRIALMAPEATFSHGKVLDDNGSGRVDWMMEARVEMAKAGVDVLSVSIGYGPSPQPGDEQSIKQANEEGTLLEVAAGGNAGYNGRSNTIDHPGRFASSFCVGSFNRGGDISGFSSGGRQIDVACPGESVISAGVNNNWADMSGTSMATPFFAGLMVLLIQKRRQMGTPDDDMRGAEAWRQFFTAEGLYERAFEDAGEQGKDNRFGYGKPLLSAIIDWLGDYENV